MIIKHLPLATVCACWLTPVHAATESKNLDNFIGRFPETCEVRGEFETLKDELDEQIAPHAQDEKVSTWTAKLSARFQNLISPPTVHYEGEYFEIRASVRGSYRSLNISWIGFAIGNGTGVNVTAIGFLESTSLVKKVLEGDQKAVTKRMHDEGWAGGASIEEAEGGTVYICDLST